MPKPIGLFDSFDNLDQINIESLTSWLKNAPPNSQLENYLANRILYPQTLPLTQFDMKLDLTILREALRINGPSLDEKGNLLGDNPFLNTTLRKIIIPERFLQFCSDLASVTWAFVDGLLLNRIRKDYFEDLWTVVVTDDTDEIVGSILLPQFSGKTDSLELNLMGKTLKVKAGSLTVINCPKDRCGISYKFTNGKILGKKESSLEIYGGKLGIMIDGRSI